MPAADRPCLTSDVRSSFVNDGTRVAIAGPSSPPLPSLPWHPAQRLTNTWRPGSAPGLYLNAAAALQTDLGPRELLRVLLEVEDRLGRVREQRFGPRTIDLDLLLSA